MAKHVDLNVQEDIVADVIAQPSVIVGAADKSIEVYPIIDGVNVVETPGSVEAWTISGLPINAYNGTYIYAADLVASSGLPVVFHYDAGGNSGAILYRFDDDSSGFSYWRIAYSYNKTTGGATTYTTAAVVAEIQPNATAWTDTSNNDIFLTFVHTPGAEAAPATGLKYDPVAGTWLYSDGSNWAAISGTSSNLKQTTVQITNSNLDANGVYTLAHGSGTYIYDLECEPEPKTVTYGLDEASLDYSDQPSSGFSGKVRYLKAVRAGSSADVPDVDTGVTPGTTVESMVVSPVIATLGTFQHMILAIVDDASTGWNRVWYGYRDVNDRRVEVTLRALYISETNAYRWYLYVLYPVSSTLARNVQLVMADSSGDPAGIGYTSATSDVTLELIGAYQVCAWSDYNNQIVTG